MLEKYALWKVLDVLISNKNEFSVREMSRFAKIGPSTSKACLDYLFENNMINKKVIGNVYQYSLNLKNPAARGIKNTYIIRKILGLKSNSRIFLCSNEKETVIFTIGEKIIVLGIETRQVTENEFERLRKDYLDMITIQ